MSFTVEQAYAQLKNLENTGKLTLPQPKDTVDIGTIDAAAGVFTWNVPTFVKTTVIPPHPPGKTNTIINVTVGLVTTKAVDLILKFNVKGASGVKTTASIAKTHAITGIGGVVVAGLPSGITISGFPTISNTTHEILVDAGLSVSSLLQSSIVSPPVETFTLRVTIPGHTDINIEIAIVRPPVLGLGAFTIPAVPITIIYAPPQGKQKKNSATYTDMTSFSRSVTTTVSQNKTVKTAQAFTAADYISKVAGAISTVAAIVGTGGAGGAGGSGGVIGALITALVGNPKAQESALSVADSLKLISSELSAVNIILTGVSSTTTSDSTTVAAQDDHTVKLVLTDMSMFSSTAGQGPGVGDRIVYFKNVRVVWMALNGEVGFHVLGFDRVSADSVASLKADLAAITSGGQNNSGLDAEALQSLLNMDPFCVTRRPVIAAIGPPLVSPPRFVPAKPAERSGVGTGASGDVFTVIVDQTVIDKHSETSSQVKVTDEKPGWISAMFGGSDTQTTTTVTFTNTQVSEVQNEQKITNAVALFSQDETDPYDVLIFYDKTFGTFLYASRGAAVLQGGAVVATGVFTTKA